MPSDAYWASIFTGFTDTYEQIFLAVTDRYKKAQPLVFSHF